MAGRSRPNRARPAAWGALAVAALVAARLAWPWAGDRLSAALGRTGGDAPAQGQETAIRLPSIWRGVARDALPVVPPAAAGPTDPAPTDPATPAPTEPGASATPDPATELPPTAATPPKRPDPAGYRYTEWTIPGPPARPHDIGVAPDG